MEITELTKEQQEEITKAQEVLKEVGLTLLEVGSPRPPKP